LDWVECKTTGLADVIFVNSHFTESVFRSQFPSLGHKHVNVLYPSLNVDSISKFVENVGGDTIGTVLDNNGEAVEISGADLIDEKFQNVFVSLNRFEVKKNIELAIQAFAVLRKRLSDEDFKKSVLVLAGGYDLLNDENIAHYKSLKSLVADLMLVESVIFCLSPSDALKFYLYKRASLVVYTPMNEHFGIVPLEAMYMGKPVLATKSGGPMETIEDKTTGFLCANDPVEFCEIMHDVILNPERAQKMGEDGRKKVVEEFSFENFSGMLNDVLTKQSAVPSKDE